MTRPRKYVAFAAVLVIVSLLFLISPHSRTGTTQKKLAVIFIGLTNSPTRTMGPPRVEVCPGATGLCALFLVTNTTSKEFLWFKTPFAEQKSEGEWKQLSHDANTWAGVQGSLWGPGYGCLMAVGWPPGLPTNSTWRLLVEYGPDPSTLGILINQHVSERVLGRDLFHGGEKEKSVSSAEVSR